MNVINESPIVTRYEEFCVSGPTRRASEANILYPGNTGKGTYGCNLMLVSDSIASKYKYTVNFTNSLSSYPEQACACWLKIGPKGLVDGFFYPNQVLTFTIPPKENRVLAIDGGSIGGCSCGQGVLPLTPFGQFAGTWLEFEMGNKDSGWTGVDASSLVASAYGLDIPGLRVCGRGTCSTIYQGGVGENAYIAGTEGKDGIGINLTPGPVNVQALVGFAP